MTLEEAINSIHVPVGYTSYISALLPNGDLASVQKVSASDIDQAKQALEKTLKAQEQCKSDAAYWGYMGQISYLRAIVSIFEASEIMGDKELPDIEKPKLNGVVMDVCSKVENFGKSILEASKESIN